MTEETTTFLRFSLSNNVYVFKKKRKYNRTAIIFQNNYNIIAKITFDLVILLYYILYLLIFLRILLYFILLYYILVYY